ncbi:MAG: class F sortase [Acidimicrobiales bacterium]
MSREPARPFLRMLAAVITVAAGLVLVPAAAVATVTAPDAIMRASVETDSPRTTTGSEQPTTVSMPNFRLAPLGPLPQPARLRIPAIGVATDLSELGLRPDRRIEVPQDPDEAGWYRHRAVPGEPGAGVIVGHVDSHTGPAVFFELRTLDVGDRVTVARDDGSVAVFAVTSVETHPKNRFPTRRVYGPTDGHELRLVTCGGAFDEQQRSYDENVVVFAELVTVL